MYDARAGATGANTYTSENRVIDSQMAGLTYVELDFPVAPDIQERGRRERH